MVYLLAYATEGLHLKIQCLLVMRIFYSIQMKMSKNIQTPVRMRHKIMLKIYCLFIGITIFNLCMFYREIACANL